MPSAITNTTYSFNAVSLLEEVTHSTNANDNKNLTGKYSIYRPYPTYLDRSTLYMKHGDTINVPISNPSGGAIALVTGTAANGTARQQYPLPTTTSTTSGGTFSLTWPSSLVDNNFQNSGNNTSFTNDAQWPFFGFPYSSSAIYSGSNVVSGSGGIAGVLRPGYKYSRKIRLSIVTGVLGFDTGETKTITQGHSSILIYSGSSITGLNKVIHNNTNSPSGATSFANKLYLSVWNSAGTAKFTNSTVSGKWGIGTSWLGFISDSNPTVSLNTASLVPGVYRIYLNHYSGATASPAPSDRRVSTDGRLYYITLTVNSSTSGPNAFDSALGGDATGVAISNPVFSSVATISGMASPSSGTVTASGNGSAKVSINGGAYVTSGTVSNGQTVQLRFNASNSYSTTHTGTLTLRGVTGSVSVTTQANPGTAGGSTTTPGTAAAYGLQVKNSSGVTIFGPDFRSAHVIATGTWTALGNSNSQSYTVEGMTASNRNTIGVLIGLGTAPGTSATTIVHYGTNGFYIQNTTAASKSGTYLAIRY